MVKLNNIFIDHIYIVNAQIYNTIYRLLMVKFYLQKANCLNFTITQYFMNE